MKIIKKFLLFFIVTIISAPYPTFTQSIDNNQTEYEHFLAEVENNISSMNEEEFSVYLNDLFNTANQPIAVPAYIPPQLITTDISNKFIEDFKNFDYQSASILPIFTKRKEKYVILGQEAFGRPKIGKRGTYDDFGGSRDNDENNPLVTAAREFFEEGILDKSLNLTLEEVLNYIKNNVHMVIANTTKRRKKHVTYIIDFKDYKNDFIQNFYTAFNSATKHENLEKNRIAIVKWNNIKQALIDQENNNPVYVSADVIDPITNKGYKKQIKLRPYFITKLKNFFLDKPYKSSNINKKIRFYS